MSMPGPRTAARRGDFTRSAGAAAGRGVLLIVFALAIGILLLARAIDGGSGSSSTTTASGESTAAGNGKDQTTAAPKTSATPTVPTTAAAVAHDPAQVEVLVLNGRQVQGLAKANNDVLVRKGYNGLPPDSTPAAVAATSVYFLDSAYKADASAIAKELGIPDDKVVALENAQLGVDTKTAKVVVVLGQDGLGVKPA